MGGYRGFSCFHAYFFSGFGLGVFRMRVFALFFPLEVAVAATAAVHFRNNIIYTFFLIGRKTDQEVLLKCRKE